MNEENGKEQSDFSILYDKEAPQESTQIQIKLNLDRFTDNPHGTALARGLFQEVTNEILLIIKMKRQAKAQGKGLLVPKGSMPITKGLNVVQ